MIEQNNTNNAINSDYTQKLSKMLAIFGSLINEDDFEEIDFLLDCKKEFGDKKYFDLVSIVVSIINYLGYKNKNIKYYEALKALYDAYFLANSIHSQLAKKINLFLNSQIELKEGNYKQSLELINSALSIKMQESSIYDEKIVQIKNAIEKLEEQNLKSADLSIVKKQDSKDPLLALLKIGRTIAIETNVDTLLTVIAQEIKKALSADRCTVFLLDEENKELWSKVALGMELQEIRFSCDKGLAGHVINTGETVNIKDAYSDTRFNKEIDLQTGYKTKTILCMPIRNLSHDIIGVFQVLNKVDGEFGSSDEDLLVAIGSSAGIALENASLFKKQKELIEEQKQLFSSFIDTLSASIDARDKITSGHSKRVTLYAGLICDELGMSEKEKEIIRQASLLHDIGKIGIKDSVLQKEGKLTNIEYEHIKLHASITKEILSKIYVTKQFQDVALIASSHHERYDGRGYFQDLSGENIPLGGRILAVSDVFDAITSKRHYRSKMKIKEAIDVLIEGSNAHFDKKIVDVFLNLKCDKILSVLICDNECELEQNDRLLLEKFKLSDLYFSINKEDELSAQESTLIQIFDKYYNYIQKES